MVIPGFGVIPLKVGVAPGTTTMTLGDAPRGFREQCIPTMPVTSLVAALQKRAAAPVAPAIKPKTAERWNPYASEAELTGNHTLGLILTPNGYTPGQPPWEIVGVYGDAYGRRGCDPQHNQNGEEGFYWDTPLGDGVEGDSGLGRGIPTDAQMSHEYGWTPDKGDGYMPVVNQMLPTADGRLLPLPWVPPNGWNPAGRSGPRWAWGTGPLQAAAGLPMAIPMATTKTMANVQAMTSAVAPTTAQGAPATETPPVDYNAKMYNIAKWGLIISAGVAAVTVVDRIFRRRGE